METAELTTLNDPVRWKTMMCSEGGVRSVLVPEMGKEEMTGAENDIVSCG